MAEEDFSAVPLKAYVDSQLTEVRRAVEVAVLAKQEAGIPLREHFDAILDEQRRGMLVAEQEREKAARALAVELTRSITEGDTNLREHIKNQIDQIRAALESAERLEVQRIEALGHSMSLIHEASEKAISKAENATEKRLESLNELRGSMADQTNTFLPREVAEAQLLEMRRAIADLTEKVNRLV